MTVEEIKEYLKERIRNLEGKATVGSRKEELQKLLDKIQ